MILRDYQQKASDLIIEAFKESQSALLVLPTGGGKTVIFADVIRRVHPQRAIVVAHREELIFQAKEKIQSITGLRCEIEMGDLAASIHESVRPDVVIATVQTQISGNGTKRMHRFPPDSFGLLIIDEAHHAVSPSYAQVMDHYKQNPDLKILAVTATPDRLDEKKIGKLFGPPVMDYEINDAIDDGWLVPISQRMVRVDYLDYTDVRTTAGDLNLGDLEKVMMAEKTLQGIAGASLEIIGERRSIVFTVSVDQARTCSEIFNRHRCGCSAMVCGATPKEDRRHILREFAMGNIQIVCNCGVLTEGFDDCGVECIVMARPTKSRALYSQMVGRATRPLQGVVDGVEPAGKRKICIAASEKPSCEIVDFVGNSGRHKLITTADILGANDSDEVVERALKKVKQGNIAKRMDMVLAEARDEIEEEKRKEIDRRRQLEEARKSRVVAKVRYTSTAINPFDVFDLKPVHMRGWDEGKQLSEKQRSLMRRQGLNPDDYSYSEGRQIINNLFFRWNKKLCTLKQAAALKKRGLPVNVTMQQASQLLDALAANRWQRTPEVEALAATFKE